MPSDATLREGDVRALTYARSSAVRPRHRWVDWVAVTATLVLLPFFYIALVPARSGGSLDYMRQIPLSEAVEYALRVPPHEVMSDGSNLRLIPFVPVAVASAFGLAWFRRRRRS